MAAAFLVGLFIIEVIAYLVLLVRLGNIIRERLPSLFATVGAPGVSDYLIYGAPFISRLESHLAQIAKVPPALRLMRTARYLHVALIATVCLGVVAMVIYANQQRVAA